MNKKELKKIRELIPDWNWRYPKNWIRYIKYLFHELKAAHRRAVYGIDESDCWDLSFYVADVLKNGLITFKEETQSYPVHLTEEEWNNVIEHMIKLIDIIRTDGTECEEAEKKWDERNEIDNLSTADWEKKTDAWMEAVTNWEKYRQECLEELCDLMKEYFFHLWW